jgi:hypothetical protein
MKLNLFWFHLLLLIRLNRAVVVLAVPLVAALEATPQPPGLAAVVVGVPLPQRSMVGMEVLVPTLVVAVAEEGRQTVLGLAVVTVAQAVEEKSRFGCSHEMA